MDELLLEIFCLCFLLPLPLIFQVPLSRFNSPLSIQVPLILLLLLVLLLLLLLLLVLLLVLLLLLLLFLFCRIKMFF